MKYKRGISARKAAIVSAPLLPACVLIWVARQFFHVEVPGEVGAALSSMLGGAAAYIANLAKHGSRA